MRLHILYISVAFRKAFYYLVNNSYFEKSCGGKAFNPYKECIINILISARTDLNDVKNNVTCLGGTWRKIFTTLIRIYRNFSMIDSAIHLVSVQIAVSANFIISSRTSVDATHE